MDGGTYGEGGEPPDTGAVIREALNTLSQDEYTHQGMECQNMVSEVTNIINTDTGMSHIVSNNKNFNNNIQHKQLTYTSSYENNIVQASVQGSVQYTSQKTCINDQHK